MPRVSASTVVPASPEIVFDFVADYRNIPRLQPQFVSVELASEQERGLGAVVTLQGRFRGMPMEARNQIITFNPPRRLVSVSEGTVMSRNAWEFEPAGEGRTRVTLTIEYKVKGLLGGLAMGLAHSLFDREVQKMSDDSLRRLAEILAEEGE